MRTAVAYLLLIPILALGWNPSVARAGAPNEDLSQTIQYLLDFVARSNSTFIRNGSSYTPKEAVDHITAKYEHYKKEIKTPEDFIRLAASKSLVTGRAYRVRTKDGNELEAADWLGKALNNYRAERRFSDRE
jgi:hypothetical protein